MLVGIRFPISHRDGGLRERAARNWSDQLRECRTTDPFRWTQAISGL